jgi:RsiW-degrading membrane proteinase PrsW (M82 family)
MEYLILALAPVFAIAFYIYFRDKYEKEPVKKLITAFIAGVLIALPVSLFETLFATFTRQSDGYFKAFWDAFMVASLNEEAFKLAALTLLIWKSKDFNEKFDGIVYASFISLGFAAIENVLYVFQHGFSTGIARAITAVPAHAFFGITMGFFFGMAKFYPKKRKKYLWMAFLVPFALHGTYDFILMVGHIYLLALFIPFVIYLWISGFKRMKQMNNASIFRNDIDLGIDFSKVKDYRPNDENS